MGNALSAFGLGFTVPYPVRLCGAGAGTGSHDGGTRARRLRRGRAVVLPFAGRAIVRRGPLPVLLVALVTAALGAMGLGLAADATP